MTTIILDGLNEEDFRRSIENRLREGTTGAAIARLRVLLAPYARPGGILPERFLTVEAADFVLSGWDKLGDAILRHDQPGRPVTALSIAFGWPGDEVPVQGVEGRLRPHVETSYFNDNAYPFSRSGREDLLEGYNFYGCSWSGDSEATDTALSLEGIDDLHGALARLEARLLASDEPDEEGVRAGSLGACLLSALLVQAVTERITRDELPRPLCVMVGSSGVYPYFDAPVVGMPEDARKAAEAQEDIVDIYCGAPAPRYSSLLITGIPLAKKRAVLVLDEGEDELANRVAKLRSLSHHDGEDGETQREATPTDLAHEMPDPAAAAASSGPLLARKPASQGRDIGEMLGSRQPDPSADGAAPHEPADKAEPALTAGPSTLPLGPGFALLDSDQQQRLQSLLTTGAPPIAEAPWPLPPSPADQPAPHLPGGPGWVEDSCAAKPCELLSADPIAPPVPAGAGARLSARLQGRVKAWLARFGLWRRITPPAPQTPLPTSAWPAGSPGSNSRLPRRSARAGLRFQSPRR